MSKAELIRAEGPWRNVEHVELETLRWVDFYNMTRPHEALDDLSPMQAEDLHYHRPRLTARATKPSLRTPRGGSLLR